MDIPSPALGTTHVWHHVHKLSTSWRPYRSQKSRLHQVVRASNSLSATTRRHLATWARGGKNPKRPTSHCSALPSPTATMRRSTQLTHQSRFGPMNGGVG